MALADLHVPLARAMRREPWRKSAIHAYWEEFMPPVGEPTWTDAYGNTRYAHEMLTEHLWNVMGWIRFKRGFAALKTSPFYWAARNELRKRGVL